MPRELKQLVDALQEISSELKRLARAAPTKHATAMRSSLIDLEAAIYNLERNVLAAPLGREAPQA